MKGNDVVLRFDAVSFEYGINAPILDDVSFSIRNGSKITIMGQNGAGKSTIFKLITRELSPESGDIHINKDMTIATAKQVIARDAMGLTVREFFEKCFDKKIYDIDPRIDKVLDVVNLHAPHDKKINSFSGGQQARLLLASALIQNPDILLLDEPTNNLDKAGIEHLTKFLIDYKKTVIVISHDAEFLNAFTQGVLYLDVFTKKVEQYAGNYHDLVKEISARIEKENRKNARLAKEIQENKDKANFFAHKGGQMRLVAKKMREKVEAMEAEKVDIRKEDKTIRPFYIQSQPELIGEVVNISSFTIMKNHKEVKKTAKISLHKKQKLLLVGPNGIGKSSLLESMARGNAKGVSIAPEVRIGYYRQDFSTLNYDHTVRESLLEDADRDLEESSFRGVAAGFLLDEAVLKAKIGTLSEGQKGLVSFARLVLQKPGLLILDEPTNHINFRHIPIIAAALNKYDGTMILVSHVPDFVQAVHVNEILDLDA